MNLNGNPDMNGLVKTAVIMAAGMGTRFGHYTEAIPKGFIPFKGKAMVLRSIDTLIECGIEKIVIGTGYHREAYEALEAEYPQIRCVFSPRYAETNSMYTLWNCREAVGDDDFLLLESDIVFDRSAVEELIRTPFESAMLITPVRKFQDQYYVQMDGEKRLVNCSTDKDAIEPSGELVGAHKLSNRFYRILCDEYDPEAKPKLGYEFQLLDVSRRIEPMNVLKLDDLAWYEIDDENDLRYAEANIDIK